LEGEEHALNTFLSKHFYSNKRENPQMKTGKLVKKEVQVLESASVEEATHVLLSSTDDMVVVVDKHNSPQGVITAHDLLTHLAKKGSSKAAVTSAMSSPCISIHPETDIDETLKVMDSERLRKCPVVMDNKVIGLVTMKDVVDYESNNIRFHRNLQNGILIAFVLFEISLLWFSHARGIL
jgi:signal-transduction protein with cAMP-binding, CBS, and nucleotidyltransferase domain